MSAGEAGLREAILAVCDRYEAEYGIGFADSTFSRADIEVADESTLRRWWSKITWTVSVSRADDSPATGPEAFAALVLLYPGGDIEFVDAGVFDATLPPDVALTLIREGDVRVRIGGLTITAETP